MSITKKNEESTHRIDTGMYTNIAWTLMRSACDSIPIMGNVHAARDKEDGQVYLRVWTAKTWKYYPTDKNHPNVFFGKSDAEVLSTVADRLKSQVESAASTRKWPSGWWNGKSERKCFKSYHPDYYGCEWITITVGDVFKAFSFLKGLLVHADSRVIGRPLTKDDFERLEKAKDAAKAEANAQAKKEIAEWDEFRQLHTGLYSDVAYNLLHRCIHASLVFIPEKIRSFNNFCKVKRAEDKEILLEIKLREYSIYKYYNSTRYPRNPFYGKTDAEALRIVGDFIRLVVVKHAEYMLGRRLKRGWWHASNNKKAFTRVTSCNNPFWQLKDMKVSEAHQIVSVLKGVKVKDADVDIVGAALPEEALKKIRDANAREEAVKNLSLEFREAVNKMRFDAEKKVETEIDELRKKFESRVRAVDPAAELNVWGCPWCRASW